MRGVVTLLYTRPVLIFLGAALSWIFLGFVIAAYSFFISSREKGSPTSNTLNLIFLALFVVFIIIAFVLSGMNAPQTYPINNSAIATPLNNGNVPHPIIVEEVLNEKRTSNIKGVLRHESIRSINKQKKAVPNQKVHKVEKKVEITEYLPFQF